MSTSPSEPYQGRLFDGRTTRAQPVDVHREGAALVVRGENVDARWPLSSLRVTGRLGGSRRRIELPEGGFIEVDDAPVWDTLPPVAGDGGAWLPKLESRWQAAVVSLVGIVGSVLLFYFVIMPWGVKIMAEEVPDDWVRAVSDGTLDVLDRLYLAPSKLPQARRQQLGAAFASWQVPDGVAVPYRLHFRDGERLGPNALALPSGDIVVTDQLIALASEDGEVLGVLAHELGHLRHKHGLRQTIQGAFVTTAVALWFGDMGDISGASAALINLRYSRDFEREADGYAAAMMQKNGVSPALLARILGKLAPDEEESALGGYLATHPVTAERIKSLKAHTPR